MLTRKLRAHVGHVLRPGSTPPPPAPAPPATGPEATLDLFRTLYGRAATAAEAERLAGIEALGLASPAARARHILARFDRQEHPSPFTVRFGADDLAYVPAHGAELAVDRADIALGGPLLHDGRYEDHLSRFLEDQIRPGMTVVDIGANIGYHTLLAAGRVGPTGRVLAFEPNSENCRLLLLSLRRSGLAHVTLFPVGLSDRAGAAYFSPHLGSNGGLLSPAEATLLNPNCVVIPTLRLDDLTADTRVDLIKLDTEGAEGLIVAGARRLLERDRPVVTSEFSTEMLGRVSGVTGREFLDGFRALGYRAHLIERGTGDLCPIDDPGAFLDGFALGRIEDLAFLPTTGPHAVAD